MSINLEALNIWPGWSVVRLIGEGSFGKVYEIVRSNFGIEEHSALKVVSVPSSQAELQSLRNEGMDDVRATEYYRGLVDEFVQEIALMSKLKGNSNIVGYEDYAVIEHENTVGWDILIRMELLTDLPSYIRQNSLTPKDIIKLSFDVCNALEVCQAQKIIHRDIKLDNIFISPNGDYKLGDFGVARTIEKTISGLSKKGTYTYMAPEVYKGEAYGANVDLYSLGIVMYKLLNNNREPFLPPHPQLIKYNDKNNALIRRMSGEQIIPPANADGPLSDIILKACAFRSVDRYQTPSQMKDDLNRAMNGFETQNAPVLLSEQVEAFNTKSSSGNSQRTDNTSHQTENSLQSKAVKQTGEVSQGQSVIESQSTSAVKPNVYVFGNQNGIPAQPVSIDNQKVSNAAAPQSDAKLHGGMTCYRCGHKNDNDSKFCGVCGAPFIQNQGPTVTAKNKTSVLTLVAFILGLLSVLCAGIVLICNCLEVKELLIKYGTYYFKRTNYLAFYNQYFSWSIICIMTAFCIAFSKKDSKSIPIVVGIDGLEGTITFAYGVFIYGSSELINIAGLLFNFLICGAAIIWLIKPQKSWISSIILIASFGFFLFYEIQFFEMNEFALLRILGLTLVNTSIVLKGFSSSESNGRIKQIDTPVFWIVMLAVDLLSLVSWFARFA